MTAARSLQIITVQEYLEGEALAKGKHEYVGGYVYAMAGAKNVHNAVAASFLVGLGSQLRGSHCQPLGSDTKIRVTTHGPTRFYYPDGLIVCEPNPADDVYQDNPVVVLEVLSESTRRNDLNEKRDAYLSIPSLKVYLLAETHSPQVMVYRRNGEEFATEFFDGLDAVVPLDEVQASLSLAELYERVQFSE